MGCATSKSGYNDQDIFYQVIAKLVEEVGAKRGNAHILWIDGHLSHWSDKALQHALDNYMLICFLRAQASMIDQANDNGVNAKWKSMFDICYSEYMNMYPGLPFDKDSINMIFKESWRRIQLDPTLKTCISDSFKITNLCPLPNFTITL